MRIWTISDTHCKHKQLEIPDVDMVIHAGDASNHRDFSQNDAEIREFLNWFKNLPIKYKIYIPGNHDTSIAQEMHDFDDYPEIIVLINDFIIIEGIKIYGSPVTPTFGSGWAWNCNRNKIDSKYWKKIPEDSDIIVTHGPPKGILDYTAETNTLYRQCGCKSLLNRINFIKPKYHIFGHIHDEDFVYNAGSFKPSGLNTTFINASVCNLRYNVQNHGEIIEYEKN